MARARLDGVPPDVCIVGQKEQPGATLSPGATAAAAAAKALQALAGSVAEKNKRLSRQLVSMDCAAASGAVCSISEKLWRGHARLRLPPAIPGRRPQSAPQPLARFASMISAKLRRGHALSAEHECGAQAFRVHGVACAKKRNRCVAAMVMVMVMAISFHACDSPCSSSFWIKLLWARASATASFG